MRSSSERARAGWTMVCDDVFFFCACLHSRRVFVCVRVGHERVLFGAQHALPFLLHILHDTSVRAAHKAGNGENMFEHMHVRQ